eukprot:15328269-Ditylum_brightwellii.AAC.2
MRQNIPNRHAAHDKWCTFINIHSDTIKHNEVVIPEGHCCEHSFAIHPKKGSPPVKVKKCHYSKKKKGTTPTKYSGYIYWLGCSLLVDSSKNGVVDIHGTGKISKGTSQYSTTGVMHCVLGTSMCIRLAENNVSTRPFTTIKSLALVESRRLVLQEPNIYFDLEQDRNSISIEIVTIPVVNSDSFVLKKGSNDLDDEI